MAIIKVEFLTRGIPKSSEAREDNTLVVCVDRLIALVTVPGSRVRCVLISSDVETIRIQSLGIGKANRREPFVGIYCGVEVFWIVCRDGWGAAVIRRRVEVHANTG